MSTANGEIAPEGRVGSSSNGNTAKKVPQDNGFKKALRESERKGSNVFFLDQNTRLQFSSKKAFVLMSGEDSGDLSTRIIEHSVPSDGSYLLLGRFDPFHEEAEPLRSVLHCLIQCLWSQIAPPGGGGSGDEAPEETILDTIRETIRADRQNVFDNHEDFSKFHEESTETPLDSTVDELFRRLDAMSVMRIVNWIPKVLRAISRLDKQLAKMVVYDIHHASQNSLEMLRYIIAETDCPSLFMATTNRADNNKSIMKNLNLRELKGVEVFKMTYNDALLPLCAGVSSTKEGGATADSYELNAMPRDVTKILEVACCFGLSVPQPFLLASLPSSKMPSDELLSSHGLLSSSYFGEKEYFFSGDQLRDSLYSRIKNKAEMHLLIANRLLGNGVLERPSPKGKTFVIFHIRRGHEEVEGDDRYELVRVCIEEGKAFAKIARFPIAWAWMKLGLSLLKRSSWQDKYPTTLNLHNTAVGVAYSLGDHEKVLELAATIARNANKMDDTLMSRVMTGYALGGAGKDEDALKLGLVALISVEEDFRGQDTKGRVAARYMKTKRLIHQTGFEELRGFVPMTNSKMLGKMQLLAVSLSNAFIPRPLLAATLSMRMIELTLEHGASSLSSFAFAVFGMLVGSFGGSTEESYDYASLGLEMLNKYHSREWVPRVYLAVFGFIYGWKQPISASLPPLKFAFLAGICTGDTEVRVLMCSWLYLTPNSLGIWSQSSTTIASVILYFHCVLGRPLRVMTSELSWLMEEMTVCTRSAPPNLYQSFQEAIDVLSRPGEKNMCHEFLAIERKMFDETKPGKGYDPLAWTTHLLQLMVAVVLGNGAEQWKAALTAEHFLKRPIFGADSACLLLWDALATISSIHEGNGMVRRRLQVKRVRERLKRLQSFPATARRFWLGKALLIEAELAALSKQEQKAVAFFERSIKATSKANLLLEEAIATERFGRFMARSGRKQDAKSHLQKASELFERHGSLAKVRQLRTNGSG